ncbi:MAG: hypothetical protein AB8B77_02500, partial [Alphaproteobacteria bacterium]
MIKPNFNDKIYHKGVAYFDYDAVFGENAARIKHILKAVSTDIPQDARLVGGIVRDCIWAAANNQNLNANPHRPIDIDVAVAALPETIQARLKAAGYDLKKQPFLKYGMVGLTDPPFQFEFTSLRSDLAKTNLGRGVNIGFSPAINKDWHTDSLRRDFNCNALYADMAGHIYDDHRGIDAILNRHIDFIDDPSISIAQDPLRLLRYFYYHALLENGDVAHDLSALLMANAAKLTALNPASIGKILLKSLLLPANQLKDFMGLLAAHGVIPLLFPEIIHEQDFDPEWFLNIPYERLASSPDISLDIARRAGLTL